MARLCSARTSQGWMFPKHSFVKPIFDETMKAMFEAGLLARLYEKYFGIYDRGGCEATVEDNKAGFALVQALFYILGTGSALAFFIGLLEWLLAKLKSRREAKT